YRRPLFLRKEVSFMEPHKIETPVESHVKGQSAPPRPPERKRRFQLIKLEERIAPGNGHETEATSPAATTAVRGRAIHAISGAPDPLFLTLEKSRCVSAAKQNRTGPASLRRLVCAPKDDRLRVPGASPLWDKARCLVPGRLAVSLSELPPC